MIGIWYKKNDNPVIEIVGNTFGSKSLYRVKKLYNKDKVFVSFDIDLKGNAYNIKKLNIKKDWK